MIHRTPYALLVFLLLILAAGCGEKSAPSEVSQPPATSKASAAPMLSAVRGLQAEQIRNYLRTAQETKADRLEVKWNPNVVAVDKESAMRSLLQVSRNGSNFVFKADEPALAQLEPGRVLLVWGIALRKVKAVKTKGEFTLVQTTPAALTDALTDAKIAFNAPLSFQRAFVSSQPKRKPALQTSQWGGYGGIMRTSTAPPPGLADEEANPDEEAPDATPTPQSSYSGEVGGFDYEVAFTIAGSQLNFDIEMRKSANEGNGDAAKAVQESSDKAPDKETAQPKLRAQEMSTAGSLVKGLFATGYDDVDIRLKATGTLDGLSENGAMRLGGKIEIVDSKVQLLNTEFKNLDGNVKLDAIARLGSERGTFHHNFKVLDVPVTFDIPYIFAGIPMVAQVGFNFLVQVGLNGKHAALHTSGTVQFKGSGTASFSGGAIDNGGSAQSDAQLGNKSAISPGVSGFVVAVQVPKVGLGVGFVTANIMGYVDQVSVVSIVNTAAVGSVVQCARYTISTTVHAGVAANFNPLPIKVPGVKKEYSKEIFTKDTTVAVPPTKACNS